MTRSFTRTENLVFCGESPEEKAGNAKKENKKKETGREKAHPVITRQRSRCPNHVSIRIDTVYRKSI
jgi:hypothetical protein